MTAQKILAAAFWIVSSAAFARGITPLNVKGSYTQPLSGMVYPEAVGDFTRLSVLQYRPDGSDVSAGYDRIKPNAEIVLTAYSFPLPHVTAKDGAPVPAAAACEAAARQIVAQVVQSTPTLQRVSAERVPIDQGGPQQGFHAAYAGTVATFMRRSNEAVKSDAYVFCPPGGGWVMEYRTTYPAATPDAQAEISAFLNGLAWTFPPPAPIVPG